MIRTITMPPAARLAALLRPYDLARAAKRRRMVVGCVILLAAIWLAGFGAEVNVATWWAKLGNFSSYFDRLTLLEGGARVWTDPSDWFWGLRRWSGLIGETVLIAYVGTLTGAVGAFAGCFLCSRDLVGSGLVRMGMRRLLEFCRTVPDIVFAMVFVVAFGLGPVPGVLAIALHTVGTLGKLFAEVVDNIDMKPVEGVRSTGAGWFAQVRYGVLPQVLSNFVSYTLLRFEVNVRGATVIGFVGAGGIGLELITAIRKFYYSDVSAMLLMLVLCVMLIDFGSEKLRHRLLALTGGRR
jgi:phosphonate transport system permease protein